MINLYVRIKGKFLLFYVINIITYFHGYLLSISPFVLLFFNFNFKKNKNKKLIYKIINYFKNLEKKKEKKLK
jgi:hypothetical protein